MAGDTVTRQLRRAKLIRRDHKNWCMPDQSLHVLPLLKHLNKKKGNTRASHAEYKYFTYKTMINSFYYGML